MTFIFEDTTRSFLPEEYFNKILSHRPSDEEWKEAVVYDRRTQIEIINKHSRHALKVRERSRGLCKELQALCTRRLLHILRQSMPHFHHLFPRPFQVEWLRYEPGMFFKPHQDFERYVCNGMVPYVLLVGLSDVEEGGETRVGELRCTGSTMRNGAVFFPSNMIHEACAVLKGVKICLKLEYFVFIDEDPVMVRSDSGWKSFWTRPALSMVDNYIRCHRDFIQNPNMISVTEDTAQGLHNMMKQIAINSKRDDDPFHDMMFPNLSVSVLHDIFITLSPDPIVLGRQAMAWDYLNRHQPGVYVIGLWEREKKKDRYSLSMLVDRRGRVITMNSYNRHITFGCPLVPDSTDENFLPYSMIHHHLIRTFITRTELPLTQITEEEDDALSNAPWPVGKKESPACMSTMQHHWNDLKSIQPSDNDALQVQGYVHRYEQEMCNDDESGYETVEYEAYLSYRIQTRWIRLSEYT